MNNNFNPAEKRKSHRLVDCVAIIKRDNIEKRIKFLSKDISEHGVGFVSDFAFEVNEPVMLHFSLLDDYRIETVGKVVWCQKEKKQWVGGIEFKKIKPECVKKIKDYVKFVRSQLSQIGYHY